MKVSVRTHSAGFPVFTIQSENSEFELSAFGGQMLSWTKGGVPIMFANRERAVFDGVTPYRGGAPICFPYFGKGTLLPSEPLTPQHGGSRITVWDSEIRESEAAIVLRTEQPSPQGFGPSTLACELTYFFGEGLGIEARIKNVGEKETPFQFAVHTYWACEDPSSVTVRGLGERYLDNLSGFQERWDADSSAAHTPPFDRVYPDSVNSVELVTEAYSVSVSTQGVAGSVLWNPGANHGIADLGSADFVCLESGVITPARVLLPGEEHFATIRYEILHSQ